MRELQIRVPDELADELEKNGVVEAVFRMRDAKFKAMKNFEIVGSAEKTVEKALKDGLGGKINANLFQEIGKYRNDMKALSPLVKDMAMKVDEVVNLGGVLKSLSYLNVGLSLVNIGVDVVGFAIIAKKMDKLSAELKAEMRGIAEGIDRIEARDETEIARECESLAHRINRIVDNIKQQDNLDLNELDQLLSDIKTYISNTIIQNVKRGAYDVESGYRVINVLLPAYSFLMTEYVTRFYYQYQDIPSNFKPFMTLYNDIEDRALREYVKDYLFLSKGMHMRDVLDAINAQSLIVLNGAVQIEDRLAVLKVLKTRENMEQLDKGIEKTVAEMAQA